MDYLPKKVIFLLGGKGTRFKPLTDDTPKALLKVKGKTVPEHLFDLFKRYEIKYFIFSLGFKADKIKEYYGNGSRWDVKIKYVEESKPKGTAGAIRLAKNYLKETFFVTNGDELKDIDLKKMYRFHKENNAKVTVALKKIKDPSEYGLAILKDNNIIKFIEKPKEYGNINYINAGLSIWEPDIIDLIPQDFSMYEKNIFPVLAKKKLLSGFKFDGQWFDTGTLERYKIAIKEWDGIDDIETNL